MHPEDRIWKDTTFIFNLKQVQNNCFNQLVEDLELNEAGEECLYEYMHACCNADYEVTESFEDYLYSVNKNFKDLLINKETSYNKQEEYEQTKQTN